MASVCGFTSSQDSTIHHSSEELYIFYFEGYGFAIIQHISYLAILYSSRSSDQECKMWSATDSELKEIQCFIFIRYIIYIYDM